MSLTHRSVKVDGILVAEIRGTFRLDEAKLAFRGVLDHCAAEGVVGLLLDCRELGGEPTTLERYEFAEYAASQNVDAFAAGGSNPLRVAFLGRPPLIDPQRFGETVARNRGAVVKVTTEMSEAVAWLALDAAVVARFAAEHAGGERQPAPASS